MKKYSLIIFALTLAFAPLAGLAANYPNDCTGGTITHTGPWTVHTFTSTGSTTFTCGTTKSVEYLVVAGGGGGGASYIAYLPSGAGGGAGGLLTGTGYAVAANSALTVTVGGGGAGGLSGTGTKGSNGSNSVFGSITATGGGGGGGGANGQYNGSNGGSGGGGAYDSTSTVGTGTSGQGHDGGNGDVSGNRGGGGGGAGSVGTAASGTVSGGGGSSVSSSISGASVSYAGGGSGGAYLATPGAPGTGGGTGTYGSIPTAAPANLGGGGGGAGYIASSDFNGGAGGSGIVIVRYLTSNFTTNTECTGGTIAYTGAYTTHTFTSTGSTTFSCPTTRNVEALVVAGGGGAGSSYDGGIGGGGGGAGGFRTATGYAVAANSAVTVTVGAGGAGAPNNATTGQTNGSNSVFGSVTATGGGYGGQGFQAFRAGNSGGSGGGSAGCSSSPAPGGSGVSGQGNSGGTGFCGSDYGSGGGGGAGAVGADGFTAASGNGGAGLASSISGSSVTYAGGGGGGARGGSVGSGGAGGGGAGGTSNTNGTAGTANTGGGGGGSGGNGTSNAGGAGGSGIVIVRYVTPQFAGAAGKYQSLGAKVTLKGVPFKVNVLPMAYIENLFSTYTYTGTGAALTINNGVNLNRSGGLVWIKQRDSGANHHMLQNTVSGSGYYVYSNLTNGQGGPIAATISSFNSLGFSLGSNGVVNEAAGLFASWSFAQANRFFKVAVQVHTNGAANTVDLSSLGTVGMVTVKSTVGASAWFTWHRSLTGGKLVYLNTSAVETADTSISVSGTTLTLSSALPSDTYIIYAWAHDTSANGLIQCGSITQGAGLTYVNLGWEPQWVLIKGIQDAASWDIADTMRGFSLTASLRLNADTSGAEGSVPWERLSSTGLGVTGYTSGFPVAYCAVRRGPMQQPSKGTQVYNAIARAGTGATAQITGVGFPPDLMFNMNRSSGGQTPAWDRLRGAGAYLLTYNTGAEGSWADAVTSFNMDGVSLGADANTYVNTSGASIINWFFRRYPGVFDEVTYTGDGTTPRSVNHNLGVPPELVIYKRRNSALDWYTLGSVLGSAANVVAINKTDAVAADSADWPVTSSIITVASTLNNGINVNTGTYVAYLFASKPGVSKVGSYTGNGGTKNINAKFTASARFVMIKRTDSTGDWFVWDTVRGINAGANDPHMSLNTSSAEVTTDDSIDPYTAGTSSGFSVKENTGTHVNVNGATYIYLAFQ